MAASAPSKRGMPGLLSEGLRVRHIAHFGLITCKSDDNAVEVLNRPALAEFEQIPIVEDNRIIGILERKGQKRRPLDDSLLVSADEHLGRFIFTLNCQPYRLVVDGTTIAGIVTWSDLLKTPVLLLAYSLIAELELLMNAAIHSEHGDSDQWIRELNKDEQKRIEGRKKAQAKDNLALPMVEFADFEHKAKVIQTPFLVDFDFSGDLKRLVRLRNSVAHVHKVVRSDTDLHCFVGDLETATAWTEALSEPIYHDGTARKPAE